MRLIKSGPERDTSDNLVSELLLESNDLEKLKSQGLTVAEELGNSTAMWGTRYPVVGSNRMKDVKDLQLEISENCFLTISE